MAGKTELVAFELAGTYTQGDNLNFKPDALTLSWTIPAPTVTSSATASFTALTLTWTVPAPTVADGFTVAPSALTLTWTIPQPSVSTGGDANIAPNALTFNFTIPAPSVSTTGARTQLVAFELAGTYTPGENVTLAPNALAWPWIVNDALPVHSVIYYPTEIQWYWYVPAPTVATGGFVDIYPSAIAFPWVVPNPTVTGGGDLTIATPAEVITGSWLLVSAGLELYDADGVLLADISDDFLNGTIDYDNTRKIGATADLLLSTEVQWESQQLKPYLTVTDEYGTEYRYNMGVYLPDEPTHTQGETPQTYRVTCYDRTSILDTPYGKSLQIDSGTGYLSAVADLLDEAGVDYLIDQTQVSATLPADFVWTLDEDNTFLSIINDLLLGINYTDLYADREGVLRAEPYVYPQDASVIWTYNETSADTIIFDGATVDTDLHEIPNNWVFVRDDPTQALPSEGDGIYTVTNMYDGVTSINERGRVVTKVMYLDMAADQTALVAIGDRIVAQDKQPRFTLAMSTGPNPTHWHYDTVTINAPSVGLNSVKFFQVSWSLPLDGSPMRHDFRQVV